ncbi:SDR family oxidoreductase [Flavobacterium hungaricum]|uniref:SDR family NAD(P)-dependent oxidoreductase n=1 Tax=Flavobacterium hungaricum TaxID=2082725 RepID=A0ABR9THC4_9FLAO|nr:SDR family NAD(P)-dependent oxidoreductase [Flavobacterium hungaricum]MBE8724437.1 SDR family NAD(P)-dependent oxidoreductase [Flavobacterium hungaricum]
MNIKDKTILITGGASGIGLESAKQFLAEGAKVIITGRNQTKLEEAKRLLPSVIVIKSDVENQDDALSLFDQVTALGGIDILYNNAGVGSPSLNLGIANEQILKNAVYEMNINYFGVIRLNNIFMDMLKSRKEAAIINTTSLLSMVPALEEPTYAATKTALSFYTRTLRKNLEILESNVKVFELLPPLVATEMTARRNDKKITAEKLVNTLVSGIKKDQFTIRAGDSKVIYIVNRFFPKLAFNLVNPKKIYADFKQ